ncbi:MAG: PQQ-dependent sugar dehydrogenase [Verrucomicrobia bacterium]|nr:PQQ-dependent sugar dehydrogenase [Verrucomicrobiota bacterium]
MIKFASVLLAGCLGWSITSTRAAEAVEAVECHWAPRPPVIDGKIDEAVWRRAEVMENFQMSWQPEGQRKPATATRARLLWDNEYLYFAAEMEDTDVSAKITEHDGKLWSEDVFELFFKPATDRPGYYEFQVNPRNTQLDMFLPARGAGGYDKYVRAGDFHWTTAVQVRGTLNDQGDKDRGWTVEGRIPWKDFQPTGGRPAVGAVWLHALCRYDYSAGLAEPSLSTNAPLTKPSFHRFEDYLPVKFVGPADGSAVPARVPWTTSRLVGSPEAPAKYATSRAFPKLPVKHPIAVEPEPGTGRLFLIENYDWQERRSTLKRFEARPEVEAAETLLDQPGHFYSLVLHPRYAENGWLYLGGNSPGPGGRNQSRVVRYTIDRSPPHGIVAGSAITIIEWESNGHNGGAVAFGRDGMLYVTSGDGTSLSDLDNVGQDTSSMRAKVLRLDVDGAAPGQTYRIPGDNPFVGVAGVRPETWAYGLRNPWRMSADPESGQIWVGQNGQDIRESAHLLERGANYGWSAYEGSRPFLTGRLKGPAPFTPPTIEHTHSVFRSLTGGMVYRGAKFPELVGYYVYGDYGTGRIWAAKHDGQRLVSNRELIDTPFAIAGFGLTPDGDILIADHLGDGLHRLEPAPPAKPGTPFPTRLSETGLFAATADLRSAPGVQPFAINAPAWHDGATAERLLAIPGEGKAEENGPWKTWELPDGTALAQTLSLPKGDGQSRRRIETRVLLKQANDWAAYSYRWNEEQTDATLVPEAGQRLSVGGRDWLVPSRSDCLSCHSREANFALGLTNAQLNRNVTVEGRTQNQIAAFIRLGLVGGRAPGPRAPHLVNPSDTSAPLEDRARAYLAANCSHCHVPNGGGNTLMDLTPWAQGERRHLIDAVPQHGDFGIKDARLVAPGNVGRSVLPRRVAMRGDSQMPPVGTIAGDPDGVKLIYEWVQSLPVSATAEKR